MDAINAHEADAKDGENYYETFTKVAHCTDEIFKKTTMTSPVRRASFSQKQPLEDLLTTQQST